MNHAKIIIPADIESIEKRTLNIKSSMNFLQECEKYATMYCSLSDKKNYLEGEKNNSSFRYHKKIK